MGSYLLSFYQLGSDNRAIYVSALIFAMKIDSGYFFGRVDFKNFFRFFSPNYAQFWFDLMVQIIADPIYIKMKFNEQTFSVYGSDKLFS